MGLWFSLNLFDLGKLYSDFDNDRLSAELQIYWGVETVILILKLL